jgi:transketolase
MRAYADSRDATFQELLEIAQEDREVILLTADTGSFVFGDYARKLPRQFFNVGIAEQNAISVAAGLALSGKQVFVFGLTPFVTLRCYEQIRLDVCCMDLPVTILGMGTGHGYSYDGPTHHVTSDIALMRALPGMAIWGPSDPTLAGAAVHLAYRRRGPGFIRIDKGPLPGIYDPETCDFSAGLCTLKPGRDLTLVATGPMVGRALAVAEQLQQVGVAAGVIDLFQLKPFPAQAFLDRLPPGRPVATLEEHALAGGLGSLVCETLADHGVQLPLLRLGLPDAFRLDIGDRDWLLALDGLDVPGLVRTLRAWL